MKSKCISWAAIIAFALVPINPAYAADTSPPQIVDWQLSDSQPKLIPNGATFISTFVVSDESSVDLPELYLQSTSTSQKSQIAQVTLIKKIGNLASYKATVLLSKDSAPKEWMWMFASLRDEFGNIQTNTQNLNLAVNAFNESFTANDFFYTRQLANTKESYLRNVRLLDKYASRLEDLLKKYPKDPGLLLAKIKQPDFPRTPPEGEEVIEKVESTGGSLQMFLDEIELAYSRILITEGAEASQARITAAKSMYSALSLEIESLLKKYP